MPSRTLSQLDRINTERQLGARQYRDIVSRSQAQAMVQAQEASSQNPLFNPLGSRHDRAQELANARANLSDLVDVAPPSITTQANSVDALAYATYTSPYPTMAGHATVSTCHPLATSATLRDWFAINATEEDIKALVERTTENMPINPAEAHLLRQRARYRFADQMMTIRAQQSL